MQLPLLVGMAFYIYIKTTNNKYGNYCCSDNIDRGRRISEGYRKQKYQQFQLKGRVEGDGKVAGERVPSIHSNLGFPKSYNTSPCLSLFNQFVHVKVEQPN